MGSADLTELLARVEKVRVKVLRNFLKLYFYAYVVQDEGLTRDCLRRPRVFPGWRGAKELLGRSKDTAHDYLRALKLIRDFIFAEEKFPRPMKYSEYVKLLEEVARFAEISFSALRGNPASTKVYRVLCEIAERLKRISASLTTEQCAQIIEEIASWLI